MTDSMKIDALKDAVMGYDSSKIESAVRDCLSAGIDVKDVVDAIQSQMCEVGTMFEKGRLFLPQMIMIANGVQVAMKNLEPEIHNPEDLDSNTKGFVIMGTVEGDVHDIGKNICVLMMLASGYRVKDLGRDVQVKVFVEEVRKGVDYCAMSSLITFTMLAMKDVIDELESQNIRDGVKILIGGAPVTQSYADKIGADVYGETAFDTVVKMNNDCRDRHSIQ